MCVHTLVHVYAVLSEIKLEQRPDAGNRNERDVKMAAKAIGMFIQRELIRFSMIKTCDVDIAHTFSKIYHRNMNYYPG